MICCYFKQISSQVDIFDKLESTKLKEVAPLPVCRTAHTAAFLHGLVYVGGGFEGKNSCNGKKSYRLDVYSVHTNQWSSPITTPYCLFGMTVLDNKLIIAGGETKIGNTTNKVLVLDKGQWKDYSKMPTARSDAVAVGYQSMLIVAGGLARVKGKWTFVATTELLDTINKCWYTCDKLPVRHLQLKAIIVNHTLYLLGGIKSDWRPSPQILTASLDNLSSHQLKWQSLPDTPWCFSTPAILYNKFLLTVGGRQPSDDTSKTTEVCIFNPSSGLWKPIANIPEARSLPAVASITDNRIIVIGGLTNQKNLSSFTWIATFE